MSIAAKCICSWIGYCDGREDCKNRLQQAPKQKVKIELTEYGYHCSDGCCYNYGTITKVNGIELPCHNQDAQTIVSQILEHLGYEVEIITDQDLSE